ncbi:phospholipid/cholesterol/gamma-HCH transport system substrate-binding protein [Litorimonas taeanensis]|uniref:Phospholipid/cholesterol/gamma-HCH transport system substrate-binding protein n=1 Tax=Litorimonas taeanensis TaxID=568099 RepID=A0A420WJA6_9PROT|nr:MlaD family protein [Litorimonas taeanensis]RKQ71114.1 phospholipid/cholesterol/gamma-HCH transport system substrate-binding protein [Litorimonas taeanensis]
MENKAHYALIGFFVLMSFLAVIAFILWLSNAQLDQQFDEYEVSFTGPVRGLSQGSEVRFNGLKVGEVAKLGLDPEDANNVIASIQVDEQTPVDTKSYARLEPLGLTGLSYIQIFSGGEGFPLLKDLPGRGPKRIEGQMSQIETFLDDGGSVIESAANALNRVNAVLSPDAVADFHGILKNIEFITANIDSSKLDIGEFNMMIISIRKAADALALTADSLTQTSDTINTIANNDVRALLTKAEGSLRTIDGAVASFDTLAGNGDELVTDARDAINRLSNSGLTDLEETVDTIRRLVSTFSRIADSLEQNPAQFIVGTERETVELPQ